MFSWVAGAMGCTSSTTENVLEVSKQPAAIILLFSGRAVIY